MLFTQFTCITSTKAAAGVPTVAIGAPPKAAALKVLVAAC
jgi:hypothetical protein